MGCFIFETRVSHGPSTIAELLVKACGLGLADMVLAYITGKCNTVITNHCIMTVTIK